MPQASAFDDVLQMLRAAAEPTRLRLLAVCARGELTVGELCLVLGQSQPRVSRHLKLLCDAGLLVRFREGHWVYYRTPTRGRGVEAVRQLLGWLDDRDALLKLDYERSGKVREQRSATRKRGTGTQLLPAEDANAGLLRDVLLNEATKSGPVSDLLDIGTGTGRILKWLAPQARQAVGVDISTDALRMARAAVHGAGLGHCVLQQGDMYELPFAADSFDLITMERVLGEAERPAAALQEAARLLRPQGRLVIVEDYDRLEAAGELAQGNALVTLRQWLKTAGLDCERLRPVETGTQHLILAVGRQHDQLNVAA